MTDEAEREEGGLADWIRRWRTGDQTAAASIYEYYVARVERLLKGIMSPALVREFGIDQVANSVLDSLLVDLSDDRYVKDPNGTVWFLIPRIAKWKAASYGRRLKGQPGEENDFGVPPLPEGSDVCSAVAELFSDIRSLLEPLDSNYFEIFQLRWEGYTNADIAKSLGITTGTVRKRVQKIGDTLSRWLDENEG